MMVSTRLRPRMIPSAPRTQLIGAMFAPPQIQNCWIGVESRSLSGIGSIPGGSICTASASSCRSCSVMDIPSSLQVRIDGGVHLDGTQWSGTHVLVGARPRGDLTGRRERDVAALERVLDQAAQRLHPA